MRREHSMTWVEEIHGECLKLRQQPYKCVAAWLPYAIEGEKNCLHKLNHRPFRSAKGRVPSALPTHGPQHYGTLAITRADGSLRRMLVRLSRIDVLVIDDWAINPDERK